MSIQSNLQNPQLVNQLALDRSQISEHFADANLNRRHNLTALDRSRIREFLDNPPIRQLLAAENIVRRHNVYALDSSRIRELLSAETLNLNLTDDDLNRSETIRLLFRDCDRTSTYLRPPDPPTLSFQRIRQPILPNQPILPYQLALPDPNPFLDILRDNPIFTHNFQCPKIRLIVARPLKELVAHVRNLKLPSLRLIARAIKTLVLGIFRWHLCDYLLIQIDNSIFQNQKGRVEMRTRENLNKDYPYLLKSAFQYELIPRIFLANIHIKTMKQINAQSLVELCKRCGNIVLTSKEKGNTLYNLLISKQLKLLSK